VTKAVAAVESDMGSLSVRSEGVHVFSVHLSILSVPRLHVAVRFSARAILWLTIVIPADVNVEPREEQVEFERVTVGELE